MSAIFVLQTIIEIIMALFVIWCFINEKKLIRFEERVRARLIRKYRRKKQQKLLERRSRLHARCAYTPELPGDGPLHVA